VPTEAACRLGETTIAGWRAVVLENGLLRASLLPDKGAEIVELTYLPTATDVLFHAPWGLPGPSDPPREGSDGHAFLERYGGGWQELFPSVNEPCLVDGREIPFHGEVASLPWTAEVIRAERDEIAVRFDVECRSSPFRLERTVRLKAGSRSLLVEETASNHSSHRAHAVWGHHCVLGEPLVAAGARLRAPAGVIETPAEPWEETARLRPGQRARWPKAELRDGGTVDLSLVPGPEAASHDDVYLTDLDGGWVEVENPSLGLVFRLEFDNELFRWLVFWQPYGGARALPLAGSYALGVEPWTSRHNLAQAVRAGEALVLEPGASRETRLAASIFSKEQRWARMS
jgi:galactose mutarotase-like enzyme